MRVMQVTGNEVIDVVAMGHGFVATRRPVYVGCVVARTAVIRRAGRWIPCADGEHVLVDMPFVGVVQVAGVQVIGVTVVENGRMAASGLVGMVVLVMDLMVGHDWLPGGGWMWADPTRLRSPVE